MLVPERKLLGMPLDPNQTVIEDWDVLPGIGPVLAESMVHDRQLNDVFASFPDLTRFPGLGEIKVQKKQAIFETI
jgi:competence protein ComEA